MKHLDKLLNNIRFEKKYVFFSVIIVILGIITGAFFIVILNESDKNIVIEYISDFIENINQYLLHPKKLFWTHNIPLIKIIESHIKTYSFS